MARIRVLLFLVSGLTAICIGQTPIVPQVIVIPIPADRAAAHPARQANAERTRGELPWQVAGRVPAGQLV
jgi:hypothetical protein